MPHKSHPQIIQGGMGVAVSGWRLARAVALQGELGVVSGTILAVVLARRLQEGDASGELRRAVAAFPNAEIGERIVSRYWREGGKSADAPYAPAPMPSLQPSKAWLELTVVANFVEVYLAKEGHAGKVGINLLEKIQFATLPSIYGAMLAGVDYVLMGAGIPRSIPGVLDALARGEAATLRVDVEGQSEAEGATLSFSPTDFLGQPGPTLKRPDFLAVISSATLALTLAKKSNGRVDGFVVEGELAGGHNAPPRGPMQLNGEGEPIYGVRDLPDLAKIRELGLPFWLAGTYGRPGRLAEALALGAAGVQVGTAFAFCEESGLTPEIKAAVLAKAACGDIQVKTDPLASPTGFPFKVVGLEGSLSQEIEYGLRPRVCDLGYLRRAYVDADGRLGYRCAAEPVEDYVRKGGLEADTVGRKCLCNGLLAGAGHGQHAADGSVELPLVTAGNDTVRLTEWLPTLR